MVQLRGFMLDISGTLHVDYVPTPGAVAALARLRQSGVQVRFVTNSTKISDNELHARLRQMGFAVGEGEVFSSLSAAKQLVVQRGLRPLLLLEDGALAQFGDVP
ncbi:Haloacid dehalogenase-like hydrolase domain-containing protein 2, partial [Coemansia spiralis]